MPYAGIVLLILVVAIPVGLQIAFEIRTARRAGMSDATPVCASCHYPLGGWSTPRCPECGKSVSVIGVRTGPRLQQVGLGALVVLVALLVVGPSVSSVCQWMFAAVDKRVHTHLVSDTLDDWYLLYESDYRWQRFPLRYEHDSALVFTQFTDRAIGGMWRNGRYSGPATRNEVEINFDQRTGLPSEGKIRQALEDVSVEPLSDAILLEHVQAIREFLDTATAFQHQAHGNVQELVGYSNSPIRGRGSGGGGGTGSMTWQGNLTTIGFVLGGVLVTMLLGFRAINRWCRSGWRMPVVGEWGRFKT